MLKKEKREKKRRKKEGRAGTGMACRAEKKATR
jgi:hypothetical protein